MPKISKALLPNHPSINNCSKTKKNTIEYSTAKNALITMVYERKYAFRLKQFENRDFQKGLSPREM